MVCCIFPKLNNCHHYLIIKYLHSPKKPCAFEQFSQPCIPRSRQPLFCSSFPLIACADHYFNVSVMKRCVTYCSSFLSFDTMSSRFLHVVLGVTTPFLGTATHVPLYWIPHFVYLLNQLIDIWTVSIWGFCDDIQYYRRCELYVDIYFIVIFSWFYIHMYMYIILLVIDLRLKLLNLMLTKTFEEMPDCFPKWL